MWDGVDAVGIDMDPVRDNNVSWALYYILFILIGSFFMINLFVGIVCDSFQTEKDKSGGVNILTED